MKKLTLLLVLVCIIQTTAISQSCLPDGIKFTSQAQIDSFQTNYPNCTEIEGDVKIGDWEGTDISNLNGLSVFTSIGGDLKISDNDSLLNLTGLDNVTSIGGDLNISNNDSLINLTGLDNVTSIDGGVSIWGNNALTSLTGLEGLTIIEGNIGITDNNKLVNLSGFDMLSSIGGDFYIGWYRVHQLSGEIICDGNASLSDITALSNLANIGGDLLFFCNDSLKNLSGLESLTSIGGALRIGHAQEGLAGITLAGNPSLTDITGLASVTSIGGNLDIQGNVSLASLTGLENIEANSIANMTVISNNSLSSCEVQSICDYLSDPNGIVEIHDNATGCNNPFEVANSCGITLPCLPFGNYYFLSQADIDNFQSYYPACTELMGSVKIDGNDISNLYGLNVINSITGDLNIRTNHTLINLEGLEGLNYIGDDLAIYHNESLASLTGMTGLQTIGGDLVIGSFLWGNPKLLSLTGLKNVTSIGGDLHIEKNHVLNSLNGLDNIDAGSISSLVIRNNSTLSTCEVHSVCDYLVSSNGYVSIYDNASGCSSPEEVLDSCDFSSLVDYGLLQSVSVHPNPFSTSTTIAYDLQQSVTVQITIYNNLGEQINVIERDQSAGKQKVIWDAMKLPPGMYFCILRTENRTQTIKMIKLK